MMDWSCHSFVLHNTLWGAPTLTRSNAPPVGINVLNILYKLSNKKNDTDFLDKTMSALIKKRNIIMIMQLYRTCKHQR